MISRQIAQHKSYYVVLKGYYVVLNGDRSLKFTWAVKGKFTHMNKFRAPYRIVTVYERLKARPELGHCDITMEELEGDGEAGYFPRIQYDTARVFVRYKGFSINIVGKLEQGHFAYNANAYCDDTPWNPQHSEPMENVDKLVDIVVGRFATIPKD
jgi:hypothetical protein